MMDRRSSSHVPDAGCVFDWLQFTAAGHASKTQPISPREAPNFQAHHPSSNTGNTSPAGPSMVLFHKTLTTYVDLSSSDAGKSNYPPAIAGQNGNTALRIPQMVLSDDYSVEQYLPIGVQDLGSIETYDECSSPCIAQQNHTFNEGLQKTKQTTLGSVESSNIKSTSKEDTDRTQLELSPTHTNYINAQDSSSNHQSLVNERNPTDNEKSASCFPSDSTEMVSGATNFLASIPEICSSSTQLPHDPWGNTSTNLENNLPNTQLSEIHHQILQSSDTSLGHNGFVEFSHITEHSAGTHNSTVSLGSLPRNKLVIKERKRISVSSSRPPALTKAMRLWVTKTEHLLDPFREDHDCWLHPSPPGPQAGSNGTQRAVGKLQKSFAWHDRKGRHSIALNYGIVHKLANHKMTRQQKDGFINKKWHLSHRCGNWTCLNPNHTTVEPGWINISRNLCFSHRSGCLHDLPCMKDKKISLGLDGKPVDLSIPADSFVSCLPNEDNDWTQDFEDDDEYITMNCRSSLANNHDGEEYLDQIFDIANTSSPYTDESVF